MTKLYLRKVKAGELRLGDKFISWRLAQAEDHKASRILDIKDRSDHRVIILDDGTQLKLHPEHICLVEVIA